MRNRLEVKIHRNFPEEDIKALKKLSDLRRKCKHKELILGMHGQKCKKCGQEMDRGLRFDTF